MEVLQDLMQNFLGMLESIDDEEFRKKIKQNFFAEVEAFSPLIPRNYLQKIKKTKLFKIRKLLEKTAQQKQK